MGTTEPGSRAQRDALRRAMLADGEPMEAVAAALTARWGFRPRPAFRHAFGWTQDELAVRLNHIGRLWARPGADPERAAVSGSRIGEYERWPHGGRRPTAYTLLTLAAAFDTSIERLLDEQDWAAIPVDDRAVVRALSARLR